MGMRKQNLNQKRELVVVCLLRKATLVEQPNKIDLLLFPFPKTRSSLRRRFVVYNELNDHKDLPNEATERAGIRV
ncbi:hypothetical protein TB2_013714 [Malus domestica]